MNDIEKMCREHFNEPMLSFEELGRVIGYGEDACDCYLIVKKMDGSIIWNTGVGGYIFLDRLKGQWPGGEWDDYKRLDNTLELNKCPKEKEFKIVISDENPFEQWEKMKKTK